jgi:hypothetical protein
VGLGNWTGVSGGALGPWKLGAWLVSDRRKNVRPAGLDLGVWRTWRLATTGVSVQRDIGIQVELSNTNSERI